AEDGIRDFHVTGVQTCALPILFIISYSSAISVMGQTSARLSLTECVRLAVEHNPTLKQTELNLYRNEVNYKQAHYNRLPSLEGRSEERRVGKEFRYGWWEFD